MADYTYAFDTGVYDTTKMGDPAPINTDINSADHGGTFPLSAANNSFALISAGKVNHKDVEGVLFNYNESASAHHLEDFYLQPPGDPDHPDYPATAVISLSAAPGTYSISSGSYVRLTTTNGNLSTLYAVPSGVTPGNLGEGITANTQGSTFYSNTGTDAQVLQSIADALNFHGTAGAFNALRNHGTNVVSIEQRTGGASGNTTIAVSGTTAAWALSSVINVDKNFEGGADALSDSTHIRAAAGTGSGYDGQTVAVVTTTGMTVTYTLEHGAGPQATVAVLSGFNLATGPNLRRLTQMGYR
jgi:hypothetical protein